jgi:phosphohistidine phosphatase
MRTLYLLRHAKSARDDPELDDHERPLAPRGKRAGRALARHFRQLDAAPQLILCSTAQRTRDTLDLVMPGFAAAPIVALERGLYLATARSILGRVRAVEDRVQRVLVVGHNPGLQELAIKLARESPAKIRAPLTRKFPTAALATYAVEGSWSDLDASKARLTAYVIPAELDVA